MYVHSFFSFFVVFVFVCARVSVFAFVFVFLVRLCSYFCILGGAILGGVWPAAPTAETPHGLFSPDLHAKETSKSQTEKERPSPGNETGWTFLSLSGVGLAKPCAQVGSAQHISLEIQEGMCSVIHLFARLTRSPCSSEAVQSPVLRAVRAHSHKGLHMTNPPNVRNKITIARMRHGFRCSVKIFVWWSRWKSIVIRRDRPGKPETSQCRVFASPKTVRTCLFEKNWGLWEACNIAMIRAASPVGRSLALFWLSSGPLLGLFWQLGARRDPPPWRKDHAVLRLGVDRGCSPRQTKKNRGSSPPPCVDPRAPLGV